MKTSKLKNPLFLNKTTITRLTPEDEKAVRAGVVETEWCTRVPCTITICKTPPITHNPLP